MNSWFERNKCLYVFLTVLIFVGITFLIQNGISFLCQSPSPFLKTKSIIVPLAKKTVLGSDPTLSDTPLLTPYADRRHAQIIHQNLEWHIQNLSFNKRLIVRHNQIDTDPHHLPLTADSSFHINNESFEVVYLHEAPLLGRIQIKDTNDSIFTIYAFETFIFSTHHTPDSSAAIMPGTPGHHLAKIYYHRKRGQFMLCHYRSSDKLSAVITDANGYNLLHQKVQLHSNDILIMGYTHFLFQPQPDGGFLLYHLNQPPCIALPKQGAFNLTHTIKTGQPHDQIKIPVDIYLSDHFEMIHTGNEYLLKTTSADAVSQTITSGQELLLKDQLGNRFVFTFNGRFSPISIAEWLFYTPSLVHSRVFINITVTMAMMIIIAIILLYANTLNSYSIFVYMGTFFLAGIGLLLMFRLELTHIRFEGITISRIYHIWTGLFMMLLPLVLSFLYKQYKHYQLHQLRDAELKSSKPDRHHLNRIDQQLMGFEQKRSGIYTILKIQFGFLNIPSIILIILLPLFFIQKKLGSETGIHLLFFNVQLVFPVLVLMAFVFAFGTTEDFIVSELSVPGLSKSKLRIYYWRYSDLILCCAFFVISMLFVQDLAPILLFLCILTIASILRNRQDNHQLPKYIIAGLCIISLGILSLEYLLPYLPTFLHQRFGSWLDPFTYTTFAGQFIDNLWLLKDAGFNGNGPGLTPNIHALSRVKDDFILTLVLSDFGFFGFITLFILLMFIIYPSVAFLYARPQNTTFFTDPNENKVCYQQLAFWLSMMFLVQALVVSAMVSGLMPVMGIPFPFIGSGGSSLVFFSFVSVGIIIKSIDFGK